VPERVKYRYSTMIICPDCGHPDMFWGTWTDFLRCYAKLAKETASQEVGKIVGKLLSRCRN